MKILEVGHQTTPAPTAAMTMSRLRLAVGDRLTRLRVERLHQEVILVDVQPVGGLQALRRHPGPDHLG